MPQLSALVVDDSSTSRMLLTKILKKMEIHCEQATSGEDALSQLSWYHPDFIFLDHLMPGMDGFETLRALKNSDETRNIPVIMYTSQHAHRYYEEAHELGAAGVISKQIDRDKLYQMIRRLCLDTPNNVTTNVTANVNKTQASAQESQDDVQIPTVYDEVKDTLSAQVEASTASLVAARISTLETAYEELHEENRILRLELTQTKVQQEELKHKSQHFSFPQLVLAIFLAIALFGSTFTWFTTQKIEQAYIETQSRISIMGELIDEMLSLINSKDNSTANQHTPPSQYSLGADSKSDLDPTQNATQLSEPFAE